MGYRDMPRTRAPDIASSRARATDGRECSINDGGATEADRYRIHIPIGEFG